MPTDVSAEELLSEVEALEDENHNLHAELAQAKTIILAAKVYVAGAGCVGDWERDSWLADADEFTK